MNEQEEILVVSNDVINDHLKSKTSSLSLTELKSILKQGEFKKRYLMEIDEKYKQIIPYVAVVSNEKVLVYKRSRHIEEKRLHEKSYSIGVGGHIEKNDEYSNLLDLFFDVAMKEVKEEIGVDVEREDFKVCCFINDETNEVGKVHIGVGLVLNNDDIDINIGEMELIVSHKFMTKEEIDHVESKLENWSEIFYKNHVKELIK